MAFIDLSESRDRKLQMLLATANNIASLKQQKDIANQENQAKLQQMANETRRLDLLDPTKNKFLRAEMATENRLNLARARGYETGKLGGQSGMIRLYEDPKTGELVPLTDEAGNRATIVELPSQRSAREAAKPTADTKNQLQANQNAALVFGELQKLSSGLEKIGGFEGIAVKGGNIATRGKLNPQAQAYVDFMPAASVNLYRGITGDTRLSDYDAKRAYSMVWNIDQDGNVKGIKEASVSNLLKARNILLSNNVYSTKKDDKITKLEDVMFVSNAVAKGVSEEKIIEFLKSKRSK